MLHERQIIDFLEYCERGQGRTLSRLRGGLRAADPTSAIWELVLLYSTMLLTGSRYEPEEFGPDIEVPVSSDASFWIEATTVRHRQQRENEDLRSLIDWIHGEVMRDRPEGFRAPSIEYDVLDPDSPCKPPSSNQLKGLGLSREGLAFLDRARRGDWGAVFKLESSNLIIRFGPHLSMPGMISSGGPVLHIPRHPEEHPVYRSLKTKAVQAARWAERYGEARYRPLVVWIIGVGDNSQIDPVESYPNVDLKRAVHNAITDPENIDPINRYNMLGGWWSNPDPTPVSGASRIDLVAVTTLSSWMGVIGGARGVRQQTRFFRSLTKSPLDPEIDRACASISRMLESIPFATGVMDWDHRHSKSISPELDRMRHRRGSVIYSMGGPPMRVTVPACVVARLLAGDLPSFGEEHARSHEWRKQIFACIEQGAEIVSARVLPRAFGSSEEAMIEIEFGPPSKTVVRRPK